MKIKFLGAAREVTGSKHLLTTDDGKKILLDCGMYQGKGEETDRMNRDIRFNPSEIDYLILSHAHIDHSGLIPYIVRRGFSGMVLCTHATRDLCSIMLLDSARIQEHDTHTNNKKRARQGLPPLEPLYETADAAAALRQFVSISYDQEFRISDTIRLTFTDTGHILGAAAINLSVKENGNTIRLCYTSDVGRPHNSILRAPQVFPQADYIITESTYGDRLHETRDEARKKLLEVVVNTCVKKKGKLIIPSFSVGRTQEIVYALNQIYNMGWLPRVNTYVDSPLSTNATNIMRMHPECFNDEILKTMVTDPDPFGYNGLFYIQKEEDSKKLNESRDPCIIISASGMMEAGRVKHHIANSISNPANTVLAVGYCEPKTLGAKLLRGDKEVSIFGNIHKVKADIEKIESFSAHGDYAEMILYLSCQKKDQIRKIFLVHGEYEAQQKYRGILQENRFGAVEIPAQDEEFELR